MEINYKENKISENESENESQFQEKREVNELNKNKKTIKEILKPDLKKIIVFLVLMHITPILFLFFYDVSINFSEAISPIAVFFIMPFFIFGMMSGIGGILYYFLHYLFACLIINAVLGKVRLFGLKIFNY